MEQPKVMTKGWFKRYKSLGISTKCAAQKCGKQIWPGQSFVSRHTCKKHSTGTKLYHEDCWDSLFFETAEEKVLTQKAEVTT